MPFFGDGPLLSIWVHPQLALHAGAGIGDLGLRYGGALEWDLFRGMRTPFLLLGFARTSGTLCARNDCLLSMDGALYRLRPVNLASAALGIRFRGPVTSTLSLGYAFRLSDNRVLERELDPNSFSDCIPVFPPACPGRYNWDGGVLIQYTMGWQLGDLH